MTKQIQSGATKPKINLDDFRMTSFQFGQKICDLQNLVEIPNVDFLNLDKTTTKFAETFIMKVKCVIQLVITMINPASTEEISYL